MVRYIIQSTYLEWNVIFAKVNFVCEEIKFKNYEIENFIARIIRTNYTLH